VSGVSVRAQVESRAGAVESRRVRLVDRAAGGARVVLETTLRELGVSIDVDAVAARVLRLGRTDDALTRAQLAERARRGMLDVPLAQSVDARVAVDRLLPFKEDLDSPPVTARVDFERHDVVPERDGRSLDVDATAAAVARAALEPSASEVDLVFRPVAAGVTRAALAQIDLSRVLASFATYFSRGGDQAPRALNIEVAASHVDGLVLEPGRVVSFNDAVGIRSEGSGFKKAFEIFKGEMVEGTGGGTCQVASTLYAIAFFGGLDIIERLPHSRPSPYIPAGLDATVSYPMVDLKLRNPFSFPVVVHASVGANKLEMKLVGADKPVNVAFLPKVVSTTPFGRKVVEQPGLAAPKRKQKGVDGTELSWSRVLIFRDGRRKVESSRDTYPPTQEIWRVPSGYDEADLPPIGEDPVKPHDSAASRI
jgi:vancomycin resistance protein YoaR